jgi:HAD superfamily hydrolase (TIGR01509 family)
MIVLIPLGGTGQRFKHYCSKPKALIEVENKPIIFWLLDNLNLNNVEYVYIPYNKDYEQYQLESSIKERYNNIVFKFLKLPYNTDGSAQTINIALQDIIQSKEEDKPIICIDADNFYTTDIITEWNGANKIFTLTDYNLTSTPKYSYIRLNEENTVTMIREKDRISNIACTGAYGFESFKMLYEYTNIIIKNKILVKNEYYLSSVIQTIIDNGVSFLNKTLDNKDYFSLGTPEQVKQYENVFLFDLDGTLVDTDDIYFSIWNQILQEYDLIIDKPFFEKHIKGKSDQTFLKTLIPSINNMHIEEISNKKDTLFQNNIDEIEIYEGAINFIQQLQNCRIAIVSNCNLMAATKVIEKFGLKSYVNVLITSNDSKNPKPSAEPYLLAIQKLNAEYSHQNNKCIVFEDSLTGYESAKNAKIKHIFIKQNKDNKLLSALQCKTFNNYNSLNVNTLLSHNTHHDIIRKAYKRPIYAISDNSTDIKSGGGYICDVYSYKIQLKGMGSENVILKLSNADNPLADTAHKLDLFNNEKIFYDKISVKVDDIIKIPKCYGIFQENKLTGILMEDLNYYSGEFNMNLNDNINLLLKVVNDIAQLHLKFYYVDENCNTNNEVKKMNEILYYKQLIQERYDAFKTKNKIFIPDNVQDMMDKICSNFNHILDELSSYPISLCHGDLKSPNIFYHRYKEPYFLDWQYINLSKGVTDIIFLLCESIDFNKITCDLVLNYYYTLIKSENPLYDYDTYMYEVKLALCVFPFVVCVWFGSEDTNILVNKTFPLHFLKNTMKYMEYLLHTDFFQTLYKRI